MPPPPPVLAPAPAAEPWPQFLLLLEPVQSAPTPPGDAWYGRVTVRPIVTIVQPALPVRIVTACGASTLAREGSSGEFLVSCRLPVGSHQVTATAEVADGRTVTATATAVVAYPAPVTVTLHYDVILSSGAIGSAPPWRDLSFSVRDVDDAYRHRWDFDDAGAVDTTLLSSVRHRFTGPSRERRVTVRVVAEDGRLIATGRAVGRW